MVKLVFAVEDVKAGVFGDPIVVEHEAIAVRSFAEVANDAQSNICKYPDDFRLVRLGSYDTVSGEIVCADAKQDLGFASRYRREVKNG